MSKRRGRPRVEQSVLRSADFPAVTSPHMLDNIKGDGKFEFSPPSTQSFYPQIERKGTAETEGTSREHPVASYRLTLATGQLLGFPLTPQSDTSLTLILPSV